VETLITLIEMSDQAFDQAVLSDLGGNDRLGDQILNTSPSPSFDG
jgi:hypothetical protein